MEFHHPQIRYATPKELSRLAKREAIDSELTVFVITAETAGDPDPQDFYIVAEGCTVEDRSGQSLIGDAPKPGVEE